MAERDAPTNAPRGRGREATVKRAVRWVLSVAIVALLVLFARRVDWVTTWASMRAASPALLLAAALVNLLSLAVKGVRWWIFLRPVAPRSLWLAVRATAAGAGLNNVVLANGGDAARVVFVARATGLPSATVLATLALERLFDLVGYMLLLVGSTVLAPLPPHLAAYRLPAAVVLVAMIVGLGALAVAQPPAAAAAAIAEAAVPTSIAGRARRYLRRFGASAAELSTAPRFVGALLLSMAAWGGQLAVFALTARAAGVSLSLAGNLAGVLAVNAGLLIRATPGNVGVFQLAYTLAAGHFGVASHRAVAVSLLIQSLQILPTTILGVALAPEFIFRRRALAG